MNRILTAALLTAAPTFAFADLPLDCAKAITMNKVDDVRQIADQIMEQGGEYSTIGLRNAHECLEAATGVIHSYDPETGMFTPDKEATHLKLKSAAEEREAAKDRERQLEEARSEQAKRQAERKQQAYRRLVEGCENMYRREPDETITNKLCFDIFTVTGLPD